MVRVCGGRRCFLGVHEKSVLDYKTLQKVSVSVFYTFHPFFFIYILFYKKHSHQLQNVHIIVLKIC